MKFSFSRFLVFPSSRFPVFLVAATLLISQAAAQVALNPDPIEVVEIPDPNLRQAIREELQLPASVTITQHQMLRLTDLSAPQSQIVDLTGLKHASNLRSLSLWGNSISDITPLENLMELRLIDLAGNDVADISPLENLTQLEVLNLGWNRVTDISLLANLINLEHLRLYGNHIFDYRPLSQLTETVIERDPPCELPSLSIQERMQNRTFPSVFSAWGSVDTRWSPVLNRPELSGIERIALHDFYWGGTIFYQRFAQTQEKWEVTGINLEKSIALRSG